MAKQVLSRRSKAERRKDRASIGSIDENLVLPKTLARYGSCFDVFQLFVWTLGLRRWSTEGGFVDFALAEYFEHLWQEGEGLAVGNYTLAGLLHFIPPLREKLPCARCILKGWQRLEFPARSAPLTLDLTLAICGLLVLWGLPYMAYALLAGFDLFLRTSELNGLKVKMFTMASCGSSCVISLLDGTKTSNRKVASTEALVVRDPLVLSLIRLLLAPSRGLFKGGWAAGSVSSGVRTLLR